MYSTNENSITVNVQTHMWHKTANIEALLDSGATHNFINRRTVENLGLGIRKLPQPQVLRNADSTENKEGSITNFCNLWIKQGTTTRLQGFYVANMGRDRIILGYPWFRTFKPAFDWEKNTLLGEEVHIETASAHHRALEKQRETSVALHVLTPKPALPTTNPSPIDPSIPSYYHRHWRVFDEELAKRFPPAREEDHEIILKPNAPDTLDCKIYPLTQAEHDATHEYIRENLAQGYIEESDSPYASPFFFRKKKDGALRPIVDYKVLNSWTIRDTYPLPLISTILDQLHGKELFTKFDIRWGYNNIRIKKSDRWKGSFKTPFGAFKPCVMPFGMCNAPARFCRAMAKAFRRLMDRYPTELHVYMDAILIATTDDLVHHRQIVDDVLDLLEEESYFLRASKCVFEQRRVEYLGVILDGGTITIDPSKMDGLRDWPRTLTTVKQVHSVLGVLGYQRPFIPNFANVARPLNQLTKKEHPCSWTPECQVALDSLIDAVLTNPVLQQPNFTEPYFLQADASAFAVGAILTQKDARGKHGAIGFFSQSFNDAERNYDIYDRELLALVRGLEKWRHLLIGSPHPITVYTDHKNLEYYRLPQHINRRVARYIPRLAEYNYTLVHLPGTSNKADGLSRRPDLHDGSDDNRDVIVLPSSLFTLALTFSSIDDRTRAAQIAHPQTLSRWSTTFPLKTIGDLSWYGDRLVVVDDI